MDLFICLGMAAIMNSTPTKILRGIYQNTISLSHSQSLEIALDGVQQVAGIVTQTLNVGNNETSTPTDADVDDFEAWYSNIHNNNSYFKILL